MKTCITVRVRVMVIQVGVIMTVEVSLQEININQCNITSWDGNRTVYDITIQPKKRPFLYPEAKLLVLID